MRPVQVINGTICCQSLINLVDNYIDLWEYIHRLRALLGESKFQSLIKKEGLDEAFNELKQSFKRGDYVEVSKILDRYEAWRASHETNINSVH